MHRIIPERRLHIGELILDSSRFGKLVCGAHVIAHEIRVSERFTRPRDPEDADLWRLSREVVRLLNLEGISETPTDQALPS